MTSSASSSLLRPDLRILVTNDDGIHAPGLRAAEKIARALSDDVWIVAPDSEQSGASHSLTLTAPLRVRQLEERRYSVLGTPTDCVMLALRLLIEDRMPDLVISGVNRGQNLADDVTYSGTVAGAMEGALFGVPAVALSQALLAPAPATAPPPGRARTDWRTSVVHGPGVITAILDHLPALSNGLLVNVNFPDLAPDAVRGVEVTRQGKRDQSLIHIEKRLDPRSLPYYWLGFRFVRSHPAPGTDLHAVYAGRISVTPLHLDLSHTGSMAALAAAFPPPREDTP